MSSSSLQERFGRIDIYLFDQLLKGRILPGMRILDAGCGSGRNLRYFLREGYEVYAADIDPVAVETVRALAKNFGRNSMGRSLPDSNFRLESVERMSFPDAFADLVICNTVLHFARDDEHFEAMLDGVWRVLKPGGLFFSRLGSSIGMEGQVKRIEGHRYWSPDGSERFLVTREMLLQQVERLGAELADPIKTAIVSNERAMTTWVLRKRPSVNS